MAELHTVPLVLTAKTVMVCLPAVIPMEAESEFESVSVLLLGGVEPYLHARQVAGYG